MKVAVFSAPDPGRSRPRLVRWSLGGVRTRVAARRFLWILIGCVAAAIFLQDAVLVVAAAIGATAYGWSIRWMDRNGGWGDPATRP